MISRTHLRVNRYRGKEIERERELLDCRCPSHRVTNQCAAEHFEWRNRSLWKCYVIWSERFWWLFVEICLLWMIFFNFVINNKTRLKPYYFSAIIVKVIKLNFLLFFEMMIGNDNAYRYWSLTSSIHFFFFFFFFYFYFGRRPKIWCE